MAFPVQRFDRSSFGIGVLTTNRYQPPENVGDTMPSKAIQQQSEAAAAQAMADRMAVGGAAAAAASTSGGWWVNSLGGWGGSLGWP
jgi:regulator of nonsense transcripts 1